MLRWTTLVGVALAGGALWRLEVEWWGWDGLTWLTYPHLAVPAGVALFAAWIAATLPLPRRRRAWTAAAVLSLVPLGYITTSLGLRFLFAAGPGAMFLMLIPTPIRLAAVAAMLLVVPACAVAIASGAGLRISWARIAAMLAGYFGAWPLAAELLRHVPHRGSPDLIHALKSGAVVPLVVLAVGLLFTAPASGTPPAAPPGRPTR